MCTLRVGILDAVPEVPAVTVRHPDGPLLVRLLARTTRQPNGCRLWLGAVSRDGYPRRHGADLHRVVCTLAHGAPPPKAEACHSAACETHGRQGRACLEPTHLRWASRKANALDRGKHAATRLIRTGRVT